MLQENPNVYMTISKKTEEKKSVPYSNVEFMKEIGGGYLIPKTKKIKEDWKELFITYQDRLLFATDAHKKHRWAKYSEIVKDYRIHISQLPIKVVRKISFQNAEKLYKVNLND